MFVFVFLRLCFVYLIFSCCVLFFPCFTFWFVFCLALTSFYSYETLYSLYCWPLNIRGYAVLMSQMRKSVRDNVHEATEGPTGTSVHPCHAEVQTGESEMGGSRNSIGTIGLNTFQTLRYGLIFSIIWGYPTDPGNLDPHLHTYVHKYIYIYICNYLYIYILQN